MSEHVMKTIADLQSKLKEQQDAVIDTKRLINNLRKLVGEPPMYADAELSASDGPTLSIQSDEFYGQPLAASIRVILEMRRALKQGPATVNELYESLNAGGYKFETKNEDNAKRGLRISLMKNTVTFHKLPNGKFGLLEWYPNAKQTKQKGNADEAENDQPSSESAEDLL